MINENIRESRSADKPTVSCEPTVLCGASSYECKYYLNNKFSSLPPQIKDELQIICVEFTEENGGVFIMEFTESGNLLLKTSAAENDFAYDDIGAQLRIKELTNTRDELFAALEAYYKIFVLGGADAIAGNANVRAVETAAPTTATVSATADNADGLAASDSDGGFDASGSARTDVSGGGSSANGSTASDSGAGSENA